jgi:clan AA aspartic protease (TIGR02281 family)
MPPLDVIAGCSEFIASDPTSAQAYQARGVAWYKTGDYDHAIADFSQSINIDPKYIRAFYNRGLAWEKKGNLDNALTDFRYFADLDPAFPDAQTAIARVTALKKKISMRGAAPKREMIPSSRAQVPLKNDGGTFVVPVEINGAITLDFTVDSGASDVTVPADVFSTLERAGTIKKSDITGEQTYVLANGSQSQLPTFTIRSLKVGDKVIKDVRGSVAPVQGTLLLGQSFLQRFRSWSIDNTKHELLLENQ